MKRLTTLLTALLFSLCANATLVTVELNNTDFAVGDVISADIIISDIELDPTFQKIVGDFEFNLNFDGSIIKFISASFGDKLDVDPDPFWASDQSVIASVGNVLISEISYAFSTDLFFAQNGLASFVLASVDFSVIGSGASTISLSDVAIGNELGDQFNAVSTMGKNYMTSNANPVGVPEPGTIVLLLTAMAFLVLRKSLIEYK